MNLRLIFCVLVVLPCRLASGWSNPLKDDQKRGVDDLLLNRRDFFFSAQGLVVFGGSGLLYGKLVGDALSRLARGIEYPPDHERRVASTIARTLVSSSASNDGDDKSTATTTMRVLEVGMGSDCRLIRRGLYDDAFRELRDNTKVTQVDIVGVDLTKPKDSVVDKARSYLKENIPAGLEVDLTVLEGDILQPSQMLLDGPSSFDAIVCCLTLCSVVDQRAALERMRELLRPQGGCLGYIEHVAVNPDEPYRSLEWQQTTLDPIQQALAHNCHLHRYTEETIASVFENDRQLTEERFLVDAMWPVTCQACGVVQRVA